MYRSYRRIQNLIKIITPATSANVGAGFDALGLALAFHNSVSMELSNTISITTTDGTSVPKGPSNLIYKTAKYVFDQMGEKLPGLNIIQENNIPIARGLGSSSACIVAGILGADALLGHPLTKRQMLTMATAIEGHPDNVAPAMLGGFVASAYDEGQVYSVKKDISDSLAFAAFVPDFQTFTEKSRSSLPSTITRRDAVYNLARAAVATAAFCDGDYEMLGVAAKDKLHQQYRLPLIPGGEKIFELAQELSAYCVYLSGSGPTIMAVVHRDNAFFFDKASRLLAEDEEMSHFRLHRFEADNTGAILVH